MLVALFILSILSVDAASCPTPTVVYLISGTSWTVPNNWNSSNNTVEVIGGGGGGAGYDNNYTFSSGGGGGAYAKISNLPLTPGNNVSYSVGAGGSAGVGGSSPNGGAGGDTYFCNSSSNCGAISAGAACTSSGSDAAVQVCAQGGGGAVNQTGAAGGASGSSIGTTKFSGGTGAYTNDSGGGGAAGPNGAGNNSTTNTGGSGDAGSGGAHGNPGGNGTEWDASHGSGGGGDVANPGGNGGLYGAGGAGGAASASNPNGGAGAQGIIVITYTPTNQICLNYNVHFLGNLAIVGSLTKASGTFEIDDPTDPANKILFHSFVESPDAMDVYNGNATLDQNGQVTIQLPDYFDALNDNVRYQFFPLYQAMPNLYVSKEEQNDQFSIAGGAPGGEITWQITGIRHDPYILANPIVPVVEKGPGQLVLKGTCLYAPLCQ